MEKFNLSGLDNIPYYNSIRYNSTCKDSQFICSGFPGTGFYLRKVDCQKGLTPVPLCFSDNIKKVTSTIREFVEVGHSKFGVGKPSTYKPNNFPRTFLLFIGLAFFLNIYIIGINPLLGLISAPVSIKILMDIYSKHKDDSKYPVSQTSVHWDLSVPAYNNIEDYYINTASKTIENIEDGIRKEILQNYISCIQNRNAQSSFNADKGLTVAQVTLFKKFCQQFEFVMESDIIYSLDYFQSVSANENLPDMVSFSKVSLYVGVFDFISSKFDIPVIDFDSFQLYFYPKFILMVYDPFTFDVIDYSQLKVSRGEAKIDKFDFKNQNSDHPITNGKKYSIERYPFISFVIDGKSYSIIINDGRGKLRLLEEFITQYVAKLA